VRSARPRNRGGGQRIGQRPSTSLPRIRSTVGPIADDEPLGDAQLLDALDEFQAAIGDALPRDFEERFTWELVAAVLLARVVGLIRSIALLVRAGHRPDAFLLMRPLYEHVVMVCWLAASPEDRLDEWVGHFRKSRQTTFEEAERLFEVPPPSDDLAGYVDVGRLRPLDQLADEADRYWSGEIDAFSPPARGKAGLLTLRGLYTVIYRRASRAAHAELETSEGCVVELGDRVRVTADQAQTGRITNENLALSVPLATLAAIVYQHRIGGLDEDAVDRFRRTMADRSGLEAS
jgi:hypothetical protein